MRVVQIGMGKPPPWESGRQDFGREPVRWGEKGRVHSLGAESTWLAPEVRRSNRQQQQQHAHARERIPAIPVNAALQETRRIEQRWRI